MHNLILACPMQTRNHHRLSNHDLKQPKEANEAKNRAQLDTGLKHYMTLRERERERECTMTEEKRGWMGKKRFSSVDIVGESSMATSDSKIARMPIDSTELLKYWPVGLTGSSTTVSSTSTFVLTASHAMADKRLPLLLPHWVGLSCCLLKGCTWRRAFSGGDSDVWIVKQQRRNRKFCGYSKINVSHLNENLHSAMRKKTR